MIVQRMNLAYVFFIFTSLAYRVDSESNVDDWFILCRDSENGCEYPSVAPSKQPAPYRESRSVSDTLAPSLVPSPSPCQVSNTGFYGDETISNLQSEYIKFDYQMEYGRGGNIDKILDDLEAATMNLILKTTPIFPECTSRMTEKALLRSASVHVFKRGREQNIVGISSNPVDVVTSEKCPFKTVFTDSMCVVVGGVLTLFYMESNSRQVHDHEREIKSVIKAGMNDGSLSLSNTEIIHLEYIGSYREGDNSSIEEPTDGNNSLASDFLSVSFILMVTAGAIGIIALVVILMMMLRRRTKATTGDTELDNSSHLAASITDDDSTNFISSLGNSEKTLFRIWRQP